MFDLHILEWTEDREVAGGPITTINVVGFISDTDNPGGKAVTYHIPQSMLANLLYEEIGPVVRAHLEQQAGKDYANWLHESVDQPSTTALSHADIAQHLGATKLANLVPLEHEEAPGDITPEDIFRATKNFHGF